MDAGSIAALTVAISALIVAIGGQIVAIITAWKSDTKVDSISKVLDVVEKNTNSKLTAQNTELIQLREEIKSLTKVAAQSEQSRALLALEVQRNLTISQLPEQEQPKIVQP